MRALIIMQCYIPVLFPAAGTLLTTGTFAEQLRNNTTLRGLYLTNCGLTSLSAKSLAEALTTNKHLEVLNISYNALYDDGIQRLAHALQVNHHLKYLDLTDCCMTDECLAKSIQDNNGLETLNIFSSSISDATNCITPMVIPVFTECLTSNHTLTELGFVDFIETSTSISTANMKKVVNDVRKRNGLPLIDICVYHRMFNTLSYN